MVGSTIGFAGRFRIRANDSDERVKATKTIQKAAGRQAAIQRYEFNGAVTQIIFDVPDALDQSAIIALNKHGFRYVYEENAGARQTWLKAYGELKIPMDSVKERVAIVKRVQKAATRVLRPIAVPQKTETTSKPGFLTFFLPDSTKDKVLSALNEAGYLYDYAEKPAVPETLIDKTATGAGKTVVTQDEKVIVSDYDRLA